MCDPGEKLSNTMKREFMEEALNSDSMNPEQLEEYKTKLNNLFKEGIEVSCDYLTLKIFIWWIINKSIFIKFVNKMVNKVNFLPYTQMLMLISSIMWMMIWVWEYAHILVVKIDVLTELTT